jgi:hypothetical protein
MKNFSLRDVSGGERKIGVRALATAGAWAKYALMVRNFSVNPSGEYADVPWTEPEDKGYSTQAGSVNRCWRVFSEMEYHVTRNRHGHGLVL